MCTSSEDNSTLPEDSLNGCPNDLSIYDHFWRQCQRVAYGNDFDGHPLYTACRTVPEDWPPVVTELLESFGPECLGASGIAQQQEEDQWSLAPAVVPGGFVVAFREAIDEPIFGILTPHGMLGEEIPIFAALRDYRFQDWIPKTGRRLLVCASIDQVPPFLGLCLPVTTLHGLTNLNFQTLGSELEYLGWTIPNPNRQSGRYIDPLRLVLVLWDPRTKRIRQYPEIREAAQFLADAERYWHLDSHSGVWAPYKDEVRKFQFFRRVGDLNASREALVESLDRSSYAVSAFVAPGFAPRRRPEGYMETRAELEKCINTPQNRSVTAERLQKAEESFARCVEEELVQPQYQQALETEDPIQRNLGVIAAETSRALHLQSPYLERDITRLAKGALALEDQQRVFKQVSQQGRAFENLTRFAEMRDK